MKKNLSTLLLVVLCAAPLHKLCASDAIIKQTPTLTLELANRMMKVAARRAEELDANVSITIIGSDGLPLAIRRHEENPHAVYEGSLRKAEAAWYNKKETGNENAHPLISEKGGVPVVWNEHRIGGIGVCGAQPNIDREIATAALDVFQDALDENFPVQSARLELLKIILYIRASEFEETADFYRDDIGLQQLTTWEDWIEFEAGTANICLRAKDKSSARTKATNLALYSGTREDVAALHARLTEAGYKEFNAINPERDKTMGRLRHEEEMTTFWIKDPAGNTVQIESLRKR